MLRRCVLQQKLTFVCMRNVRVSFAAAAFFQNILQLTTILIIYQPPNSTSTTAIMGYMYPWFIADFWLFIAVADNNNSQQCFTASPSMVYIVIYRFWNNTCTYGSNNEEQFKEMRQLLLVAMYSHKYWRLCTRFSEYKNSIANLRGSSEFGWKGQMHPTII